MEKNDGGYGTDILITAKNTEANDTLMNILSEAVLNNEIDVIEALSSRGQSILAQIPDSELELPMYVTHERTGYHKHGLKELLKKYGRKQK